MKRVFDFIISSVVLVLFSPVFIVVFLSVKYKLGSPVIFVQERPGLHGNSFRMFKFRTMTDEKNASGQYLTDEERLTTFGKFLRSTSLDELPGLFNVLKGDMSLVGPRPLLMKYLPLYNERQATRHNVLPGITGWAQVNGRNAISWEQKFDYDVWYVENRSLWLDIKILFMTVKKVLVKEGISAEGEATITEFKGNDDE
ncbi:sugar transferase [Vibrio breoganii]